MSAQAMPIPEVAKRIIREERIAYCREVLGWDEAKAEAFALEPANWVQSAVERALRMRAEAA